MSYLKKQRLNIHGQHRITTRKYDNSGSDPDRESPEGDDEQSKVRLGRSLFVRSLPSNATAESLATFFSQSFPLKHATVVMDPVTNESKCYGFVTFADAEDAQRAKKALDRSSFDGHSIKIEFAEPRHRQSIPDGSTDPTSILPGPGRKRANGQGTSKLIVRNLPWTIREAYQLAALFRSYGKVKYATIPQKRNGLSPGFGFVVLQGRKDAERAVEGLNGTKFEGRMLAVDWAVEKNIWKTLQTKAQRLDVQTQSFDALASSQDEKSRNKEIIRDCVTSGIPQDEGSASGSHKSEGTSLKDQSSEEEHESKEFEGNSSTLFIRNLPFTCADDALRDHFRVFGAIRYARVVLDTTTERSKGTAFVCFFRSEDAAACLQESPQSQPLQSSPEKAVNISSARQTLLEDTSKDLSGRYTIDGRVLQVSRAVDREEAIRLTHDGNTLRDKRDRDKRRLYLLSEGTVSSGSPLYDMLPVTEIKMREDSARQRQSLITSNPSLHLSLTRLSIRNLPRSVTSKDLKALARKAVVGFASDVRRGVRKRLSREELLRGSKELKEAEAVRKAKGKGIVRQAKVVYEGREGGKVAEKSGAGRSRSYGFVEYTSHRWALMGLRWLNGHAIDWPNGTVPESGAKERRKRLIAEFAIENAQVIRRRHEREINARERSKLLTERRAQVGLAAFVREDSKQDHLPAKTKKATKRKHDATTKSSRQLDTVLMDAATHQSGKASKRQQVIGKRPMMRRSRNN